MKMGKNLEKDVNVWYRIWSRKETDLMAFDPENECFASAKDFMRRWLISVSKIWIRNS